MGALLGGTDRGLGRDIKQKTCFLEQKADRGRWPASSFFGCLRQKGINFLFLSNTIRERRWELERKTIACGTAALFLHGRVLFLPQQPAEGQEKQGFYGGKPLPAGKD